MITDKSIQFNKTFIDDSALHYLSEAVSFGEISGNGSFTKKCQYWLEKNLSTNKALITHSCTGALEMSALLLDIQHGDEIIMPSYTFVSTANAFVLRGAVPVFIDVREDTLNMNERLIESAITKKTKAIVPVHYAGVSCEMDSILGVAEDNNLKVIEDAAQGMMSRYKNKSLGTLGDLGAISFHATKNIVSGEGGALLINDDEFISRSEVVWEKGTDRSSFFRGEIDKYTWQDIGSSFLPSELTSALLYSQLGEAEFITLSRLAIWNNYHSRLAQLEEDGLLRRPIIPEACQHNAHIYYILLSKNIDRDRFLLTLKEHGVSATSHYIPLHNSPAGKKYCRVSGSMHITETLAESIVRLPLWVGLTDVQQEKVINCVYEAIYKNLK